MKVVGIEGQWPESALLTWGAAAILDEESGVLLNAVTRQRASRSDKEEDYFPLKSSIEVPPEYIERELIAVSVRRRSPNFEYFITEPGNTPGLVGHTWYAEYLVYVFSDREMFDLYAATAANRVFVDILLSQSESIDNSYIDLVQSVLVLAPRNPYANLMNVLVAPNRSRAMAIARSMLRQKRDLAVFEFLYEALTSDRFEYDIKYAEGVTKGRGIGIGDAAKIFQSIEHLQIKARDKTIVPRFPFLRDISESLPSHRAMGLDPAASAVFKFGISVTGESPLIRIARYIEIRQLQELLRGNVPSELQDDESFLKDLKTVIEYDQDTLCYHGHHELGGLEPAKLFESESDSMEPSKSIAVTMLGFPQGIYRNSKIIELRLTSDLRVQVSTEFDDAGNRPEGVEVFTSGDIFLYRPIFATLCVKINKLKKPAVYLRSVSTDGAAEITALPSHVEKAAFAQNVRLPVCIRNGTLVFENIESANFGGAETYAGKGLDQASSWLGAYQEFSKQIELSLAERQSAGNERAGELNWFSVAGKPRITVPARIMLAIEKLNGRATVREISEWIYKTHEVNIRRNNTRRTLRRELEELVVFDPVDGVAELSAQGKLWLYIYHRIERPLS